MDPSKENISPKIYSPSLEDNCKKKKKPSKKKNFQNLNPKSILTKNSNLISLGIPFAKVKKKIFFYNFFFFFFKQRNIKKNNFFKKKASSW